MYIRFFFFFSFDRNKQEATKRINNNQCLEWNSRMMDDLQVKEMIVDVYEHVKQARAHQNCNFD